MGDVGAALAEEAVHESGLAVVDVGYDGDVPKLGRIKGGSIGAGGGGGMGRGSGGGGGGREAAEEGCGVPRGG